jgi:hypothetical protein
MLSYFTSTSQLSNRPFANWFAGHSGYNGYADNRIPNRLPTGIRLVPLEQANCPQRKGEVDLLDVSQLVVRTFRSHPDRYWRQEKGDRDGRSLYIILLTSLTRVTDPRPSVCKRACALNGAPG